MSPGHSERQRLKALRDQTQKLALRAPWLMMHKRKTKTREKKVGTSLRQFVFIVAKFVGFRFCLEKRWRPFKVNIYILFILTIYGKTCPFLITKKRIQIQKEICKQKKLNFTNWPRKYVTRGQPIIHASGSQIPFVDHTLEKFLFCFFLT